MLERRAVSGIMLTLLRISVLTLAFYIQQVSAEPGTIYIKADGSVDPPTANITTVDNITYTFTDNIYDEIVVERDNIVVDGAGYTVQGAGSGYGIALSGRSNVTLKNIRVTNFGFGIVLNTSNGNTLCNNTAYQNYYDGIVLLHLSNNNILTGNKASWNHRYGISLYDSTYNTLTDNEASSNNIHGIRVHDSSNNTLAGNSASNNSHGIGVHDSSNNTITSNNASNNTEFGIDLYRSSSNVFSGNNASWNTNRGIRLFDSSDNTFSGNIASWHDVMGISLLSSNNNTFIGNTVGYNEIGIYLDWSSGNTLTGNTASNNSVGIQILYSSNVLFHNNFADNTDQVSCMHAPGYGNTWDDGYPSGGNYWSDYTAQDLDGDGIGDTPYVIDENNQDRYPLMSPYIPDSTPPTTLHDYDGLWHITDFNIILTATDDVSGVAETYYKINDGPTKTVSVDGQPFITTEGVNNKLEYWSVDMAGNGELPHKILTGIKLDKTNPTANAGQNQTVAQDTLVTFDGSASTDENGIASYTWTFTDITPQTLSGENPTYNFTILSTYIVTLTVEDTAGNNATDAVTITVLLDTDGDGTPDTTDLDDDNDDVNDNEDAFPLDPTETVDTDGDGIGNNADDDDDNDGTLDVNDAFPLDATESVDTDGDGVGNNVDTDDDNDGVNDNEDAFPLDSTETVDTDEDGIGNNADTDDDNDVMPDTWETENELDPLDAADASLDSDSDGLTNLQEYQRDTDPNVSDAQVFPWWILGAIAGIAAIGIVLGIFFLRRRRSVKS